LRKIVDQTKNKNCIVESLHNKSNYKIKKEFIDVSQININNQIYLIFAKNTLQAIINVSEESLTNRKKLYI